MSDFENQGNLIRKQAKELVFAFLKTKSECKPNGEGMKLAQIFRACGFDWGEYNKATSSNQQYWVVALVRELEREGKVQQIKESGPWRLT